MAVPATTNTAARLPNLDVLRGLAALGVLVAHAYTFGGRAVPLWADDLRDVGVMALTTGVWLFFALSGLVIGRPFVRSLVEGRRGPDVRSYGLRRAARLYPLYLACVAVVLVVLGTRGHGLGPLLAHLALLHNLVPDHQLDLISVTWTLTLELLFYATVPILAAVAAARRRGPIEPATLARWIAWSAVGSVVWMLAAGALPADLARTQLYGRMLLPSMWSAFCPGLLVAVALVASPDQTAASPLLRAVDRIRRDATAAWALGGGALVLGLASFLSDPGWGLRQYVWGVDLGRVAFSVAFGVLVLRAVDARAVAARTPAPMDALGRWSYGLYLIHGSAATILWEHDGGSLIPMARGGTVAFFVHVAFLLAVTVPLAALSWRFLEAPAMRAANRRGGRDPVPATAP